MRYALRGVRAVPLGAQGRDLRLGPHHSRRPVVRANGRVRARELAAVDWMVITGAGPGIMEAGIEGAGAANSVRREHPVAVRGRDDAVPRRRPEARELPLLLHAQGDVREGGARVRAAARRLRDARRGVRAPDARADGQVGARTDRPARCPGGTYWRTWVRVREASSSRTATTSRPRTPSCTSSPTTCTSRSKRSPRSIATTTRCGSSTVISCCACRRCRPTPRLAALNAEFADIITSGEIAPAAVSKAEIADDDVPDLRVCACASTATRTRGCTC